MNDCSRVAPQAIADAADGMSLASFAEVLRCGGEEELVSGAVVAATEKSEAMLSFQFGDDAWVPMHVGSNVQKVDTKCALRGKDRFDILLRGHVYRTDYRMS